MAWGNPNNIIPELAQLNKLLADHPCCLDGATLTRLSLPDSPVYALSRVSADGLDHVLVLVNTDIEKAHPCALSQKVYRQSGEPAWDAGCCVCRARDKFSRSIVKSRTVW